jgi:regulator of replication initiation timing
MPDQQESIDHVRLRYGFSLQADLANSHDHNTRLQTRIRQLEKRLSEALGENAWAESGLGAPVNIDELQWRITQLEPQLAEMRGELNDRTDELEAARAANRELTRALNHPRQ